VSAEHLILSDMAALTDLLLENLAYVAEDFHILIVGVIELHLKKLKNCLGGVRIEGTPPPPKLLGAQDETEIFDHPVLRRIHMPALEIQGVCVCVCMCECVCVCACGVCVCVCMYAHCVSVCLCERICMNQRT